MTPRCKQGLSIVLLIGCMLILLPHAQAMQFEVYGGPGGQPFTALCPAGYHMVGIEGRVGQWIDKMTPICGSWIKEREGFVNRISIKSVGTSEGGTPAAAQCPHGYALKQWTFWFTVGKTLRPKFVSTIHIVCEAVVADRGHFEFDFGNTQMGYKEAGGGAFSAPSRPRPSGSNICPLGELAVGFEGRAGLFVDALALVCGPSPTKLKYESSPSQSGNMTTLQRPGKPQGLVGSADPSFQSKLGPNYPAILSPPAGQRYFAQSVVPIKLAQPPSVPVSNYEIVVQRKDANGKWIMAHNFFISEDDAESPGGYQGFGAGGSGPTKATVLMTSPGSWRLQARVLQPTPMAWSPWVEFLVEPPLSKGSIVQTPTPAIGTGPTLIRPRGVDSSAGPEGSQKADEPIEREKKPR